MERWDEGRKGRREKGGKRKMNNVGYLGDRMAKWMGYRWTGGRMGDGEGKGLCGRVVVRVGCL